MLSRIRLPGKSEWVVYAVGILTLTVLLNLQLVKKTFIVLGESLYYNCTGTLPHIKYFTIFAGGLCYETFPYCIDEQFESLVSGKNEYIIIEFKDDGYTFWGKQESLHKEKQTTFYFLYLKIVRNGLVEVTSYPENSVL